MAPIPTSIAAHVGRTPMVELTRMSSGQASVYAKLEALNPGGSVKDRIGVAMIRAEHDRRGDQREHRDRAGLRLRSEGLRPRADNAAGDEPRA